MPIKITAENKLDLISKGWTLCSMGFSKSEIQKYYDSTIALERKALTSDYLLNRLYHPHIFHSNIAAIESPFNHLICNNGTEEFFIKLGLGTAIRKLMGWEECHLHLARLFTMQKYRYRGNWHRDFDKWDGNLKTSETIQVALYLKDQDGFRIFKYNYDTLLRQKNTSLDEPVANPILPLDCSNEYFDEVNGEAGTALFFNPGIIHQGNSFGKRLDYHMRFSCNPLVRNGKTKAESTLFDFYSPDFYAKNFDVTMDPFSPRKRIPSFREKITNSINYYTGLVNFIKLMQKRRDRKPGFPWRYSVTANTIFQHRS